MREDLIITVPMYAEHIQLSFVEKRLSWAQRFMRWLCSSSYNCHFQDGEFYYKKRTYIANRTACEMIRRRQDFKLICDEYHNTPHIFGLLDGHYLVRVSDELMSGFNILCAFKLVVRED